MGKPTGFLDYPCLSQSDRQPLERIRDFNEFHGHFDYDTQKNQAARCMDCGVPYCQFGMNIAGMTSGCPLHNLCPEWNDLVSIGNYDEAYARLRKTNVFPEFTSRVCPALCEKACTCSLHDGAVHTRDNEYAIVEHAYASGLVKADVPAVRTGKKVAVIGSGPAGLAVADVLNHRGHQVTVYEKEDRIGGLLMYGIPNMKLDKKVIDRRVNLMKEEGVTFKTGVDVGKDLSLKELKKQYDRIILAVGAKQPRDLKAEGRDAAGIYFAVDFLRANTKSLLDSNFEDHAYIEAKDKDVVIVGGGDTGNDCVGTCIRHGAKSVIQLEMTDEPSVARTANNPWPEWPKVLKTDYGQEEAIAVFGNDPRIYDTTVKEFHKDEKGNLKSVTIVKLSWTKDEATGRMNMHEIEGSQVEVPCQLLIIAAGFVGCESYVPEAFGVETTPRGAIAADRFETKVKGVYACGDAHTGQSLVVKAIRQGLECAKQVDISLMGYSNISVQ